MMNSAKKTIGIDIDDVLIDFNSAVLEFHNQTFGTNFTLDEVLEYEFEKLWNNTTEEVYSKIISFYNSPYHAKIKPVAGAVESLRLLSKTYEVAAISARPQSILKITKKLLDIYFKDSIDLIVLTNAFARSGLKKTKSEVCLQLKAVLLVDDSLKNALECSQKDITVILLRQPWNMSMTDRELQKKKIYPAKNWQEIKEAIAKLDNTL